MLLLLSNLYFHYTSGSMKVQGFLRSVTKEVTLH